MYSFEETQYQLLIQKGEIVCENKSYSGIAVCSITADSVG